MALLRRGNTYSVRYTIPTSYREVLGRSQVWRTTGTGCKSEAKRREPRILTDIMSEVEHEYARLSNSSDNPHNPAFLFDAAAELLTRDDLTDQEKHDILHDYRQRFLHAGASDARVTTSRSATALLTSGGREVPLSIAMTQHLNDLKSRDRALSTVERKQMVIERFSVWAGDPTVRDVTRQVAGRWIEQDLNTTDLTPKTKTWYLSALQSAWTYFLLHGMTDYNPWERMSSLVQLSRKGRIDPHPPRPWTQDELEVIHTLPKDDPLYQISVIRLHSGIRVEEACCLHSDDIDLTSGTFKITAGKTHSSIRTLPMHPASRVIFESLPSVGYLFDLKSSGRDQRRSHNVSKRAGRWIRKNVTGDTGVTWYTLRHTYAQALRDAGVARETIEYTTGHKDQSQLFGTYARSEALSRLRAAVLEVDFGW